MKCIKCGSTARRYSAHTNRAGTIMKNYYRCTACELRFSGYEISELDMQDYVDTKEIDAEIFWTTRPIETSVNNDWLKNK